MEKSIKAGFVKRAAQFGFNLKEANDLFKNLAENLGGNSSHQIAQGSINQITQEMPGGFADSSGLGKILGGGAGAIGGGLAGLAAGGLTNKKEDSTKQKILRALGIGAAGAIGGGLGGAAGGSMSGGLGYVTGAESGQNAISQNYEKLFPGR